MMMKKYGLITKVLLISMFAILLNGCGNLLTSEFSSKTDETKFYTITGNIDVDAHSAKNSTRTGLPTIPSIYDNSINFSVSATKDGETITGTVSGMQYSIILPKGSWTITVIGEKAGVKVLEGSITVNPEDEPTTQQTITLKTINAGTGSLSLTIGISKEENLSCGGVKATLYKNSGEESNDVKYLKFNDTDNNLIQLGFNDLPAGTYSIDLEFYQEMTSSTTTEGTYSCKNLLYSHHDTVNIFANLVTNTWTGSGYSEDKTTFTLTKAMITNFAMTTFYVDADGEDTNKGTYFKPFKTLQAAVNKVTEMNNVSSSSENAPYRILLLSNIEDTSTGEDIYTNDESLISIKNYSNSKLYLKIASYQNDSCFEIKGASGRRIMNIEEGANVTIENITLTGVTSGNINANGGGVYVANKAIFTMGNGATISNCTGDNGGGVYVQSGIFIMNSGAKINGCKAEGEYAGGGVYLNGGTFTMNGGTISGCTAEQGGGVCIFGGELIMNEGATISTCTSLLYGGGVVVYGSEGVNSGAGGTFNMAGGTISGCSAEQGGGVYVEKVTFTMTGGTISENKADCGGGIYLTGTAQLTMTGGKISDNHPKGETSSNTFGGGVHISGESSIFAMTGGEISGNSAYYGGGVAVDGSFFMSGGTISGNKVTNNSNGNGNGSGSGLYVAYSGNSLSAATFEMSGGAVISLGNDVYLATEAFIKVTGNLTSTDTVATITPNEYSINRQVITVPVNDDGATSSVTLSDQVGKFAVTPQVEATTEETINWTINANGYLELLYSDWSALKTAIEETSNTTSEFVLKGDITATSTITVSREITLKAPEGTTITRGADDSGKVFTGAFFDNQSTLTLEGITLDGGKDSNIVATAPLIISSKTLTLTDCTLQNNKNTSTTPGGAIYISAGTFTMNGGVIGSEVTENDSLKTYSWQYAADASSYSNYAEAGGGGIYVASGDVTIDNATISYNYTPNIAKNFENKTPSDTAHGGGISIVSGSLSLKGSEVSYNSGYQGGGIRCYQNSDNSSENILTLEKSKIIGNISNPYYCNGFGGGVMVKNFTVKFEGETPSVIEENYSGDGGALFLENTNSILQNTTSTLQNITIQNNSYNKNGYKNGSEVLLYSGANVSIASSDVTIQSAAGETRGIFMNNNNTLNLSGDAKLDAPIYLTNKAMVTVSAALTSNESIVATITPEYYPGDTYLSDNVTITVEKVQVLTVGTGVTLSNDIVGRFAVTPQTTTDGTTINWTINTEGKIAKENAYYVSNTGNDDNYGTVYNPFATMQKAVDTINGINDGASPYTIYVMNNINWGDDSSGTTSSVFINIAPEKSLKLKICGYGDNIEIDAQQKGSVMYIEEKADVTLENITLSNGKINDVGGGGVQVVGGTFTMNSGATISNCTSNVKESGGGGVYMLYGEFTMTGDAKISSCNADNTGSSEFCAGGGVYVNDGSFTLSDNACIENCNALSDSNSRYGGGVYVASGTFTMTGGTITNCKVTGFNDYGGGVYVAGGEFTMSGGTISGCTAEKGGGVYVVSGASFSNNGGTISDEIYPAQ